MEKVDLVQWAIRPEFTDAVKNCLEQCREWQLLGEFYDDCDCNGHTYPRFLEYCQQRRYILCKKENADNLIWTLFEKCRDPNFGKEIDLPEERYTDDDY